MTNFLENIIAETNRARSESLESRVEQMGIRTKTKNKIKLKKNGNLFLQKEDSQSM